MEYRKLDDGYPNLSLLGFGCMRFPLLKDGSIDEDFAEQMMDDAYKNGVNYFDTAYFYHDGKSEEFTGRVLSKYDRNSYAIATKLPIWLTKSRAEAEKLFESQLERLQMDYVDFYLLHALNKSRWEQAISLGILELLEELQAKGKIRRLGFSFHDEYAVFEEIIKYRKWDFCQIQLNYMDTEMQAGMKGYELATERGIPVVVMEPVKGGALASLPPDIVDIFKSLDSNRSVASWALRYVGSLPNVKVILSGMSDAVQVKDNLETLGRFSPLDENEAKAVDKVTKILKSRVNNGCTACDYCMPCPYGVNIPRNFAIWNHFGIYGDKTKAKNQWNGLKDEKKGKHCTECGACEDVCPQSLSIIENLASLQKELDTLVSQE